MAVFIVLWPYLLTTKLRSVIRHNLGHSNVPVIMQQVRSKQVSQNRFLFLIRLTVLYRYCNSDFSMLIMRNITIENLIDFE